jgi:sensor histidine kinase regulating citrate/malate metabolism
MKKGKLQLHTRIALLIIGVILISIINTAFFITKWRIANIREDIETNIMNIAQIVANAPVVKENIEKGNGDNIIQ